MSDPIDMISKMLGIMRRKIEAEALWMVGNVLAQSADLATLTVTVTDTDPVTGLPVLETIQATQQGPFRFVYPPGSQIMVGLPNGDRTQLPSAIPYGSTIVPTQYLADATKTAALLQTIVATFNGHTHASTGAAPAPLITPAVVSSTTIQNSNLRVLP